MSGKTEAILIRRGLSLYKQPLRRGAGSPYWYARVYMRLGDRTVHVKSTGTSDVRSARQKAEDYWADLTLQRRMAERGLSGVIGNQVNSETRFDRLADSWLDRKKAEAGSDERKLRAFKDSWHAYFGKGGFAAFFGHDDVRTITTDRISQYLLFQESQSSRDALASSTKKRTLAVLREVLKHAYGRQLIERIPDMPKVRLIDNPRPCFTYEEYRRLKIGALVLAREAREKGDEAGFARWMEMSDFIIFMVSSFLRPSEWSAIRFGHVRVEGGSNPHLKIAVVQGKTRKRTTSSMPQGVAAYRRIASRTGSDPDAYLFRADYPNRQTAKERMADAFNELMKRTGLMYDQFGQKRSLYSLRHTALMFRILYGDNVNILLLAKNAGTSVEQLQRFYLSHVDASMQVDDLHRTKQGLTMR